MIRTQHGYTLLELMIVVVIITILALFGYPMYLSSKQKGQIAEIESILSKGAMRMQTYKGQNLSYAGAQIIMDVATQNNPQYMFPMSLQSGGVEVYKIDFQNTILVSGNVHANGDPVHFTIRALPRGPTAIGSFAINDRGETCYDPNDPVGSAVGCTPGTPGQTW